MPFENPLLPLLDVVSPYLPSTLADPLYTLATVDVASLIQHPTQILPILLSLFAAYWAWLSFLSSARFAFRTSITLIKWGAIASAIGAAYVGYNSAGTEKGVSGGISDYVKTGSTVGKGVYSLGKKGAGYYMGSRGVSNAKRSASGRPRTWAKPTNEGEWDDPAERDTEAEDYVGDIMKKAQGAFFEYLSPPQEKVRGTAKKAKSSFPLPQRPSGLQGYAYDYALNKAKAALGVEEPKKKTFGFW